MGGQRDVDDAPPIQAYGFEESLTNFEGMGPKLLPLTMNPDWDAPKRIWEDAERLGAPEADPSRVLLGVHTREAQPRRHPFTLPERLRAQVASEGAPLTSTLVKPRSAPC